MSVNVSREFAHLNRVHQRLLQVDWWFYENTEGVMFHSFFNRSRVKGRGALALQDVCSLADKLGVRLFLWTVFPQLHAYYESFGFVQFERNEGCCPHLVWFERLPNLNSLNPPGVGVTPHASIAIGD